MKRLLSLLSACLGFCASQAQTANTPMLTPAEADRLLKSWRKSNPTVQPVPPSSFEAIRKTTVNPKVPGVYRLPGGMPCLVPDTKDIAAIPNAWKSWRRMAATMPNAAKPRTEMNTQKD